MRHWLALASLLLLWACAPAAKTYDLTGNNGEIHFATPDTPDRYCALPHDDARFNAWLQQVSPPVIAPATQQAVFVVCDTNGQILSPSTGLLMISTYGSDSLGDSVVRDEDRAALLKNASTLLAAKAAENAAAGADLDSLTPGVLYWRSVQTVSLGEWAELDAWTVTRGTPVEITAVTMVDPQNPVALATALPGLHKLLDPTLRAFAAANGYNIETAPDEAETAAAEMLEICARAASAGAIFLVALILRPWWAQMLVSSSLMAVGEMLVESAPGFVHENPEWEELAASLLLGLFVLGAARVVLGLLSLVRVHGRKLTDLMRRALSLQLWDGADDATPQGASFTKRWFVSVAAATGSVVAALTPQPGVLAEFLHAFSLEHFVFSVIVMIVTFTLIGPLENYVFESRVGAIAPAALVEETSHFERLVELATPRAAGRLLLVLAFALVLTAAHGTVESRLADGDATASLIVVLSGVGPALITYFWCLALQRRATSVARQTGAAGVVLGLTLIGLPISCIWLATLVGLVAAATTITSALLVVGIGIGFIVASLGLSAAAFGGLSLAGGLVIDVARRRNFSPRLSVGGIGVAMCALIAAYLALWTVIRTAALHWAFTPTNWANGWSAALAAVGWAIGLAISGFPGVLRSSLSGPDPSTPARS